MKVIQEKVIQGSWFSVKNDLEQSQFFGEIEFALQVRPTDPHHPAIGWKVSQSQRLVMNP